MEHNHSNFHYPVQLKAMMLKSTKSTFPSAFRSLEVGGLDRLYQYAATEKSTRFTRPSPLESPFATAFGNSADTFFVPTVNPTTFPNAVISPLNAAFDFVWCCTISRTDVSKFRRYAPVASA